MWKFVRGGKAPKAKDKQTNEEKRNIQPHMKLKKESGVCYQSGK